MKKLNLNNQTLKELYNSGLSCSKIANIYNCSETCIKNHLIKIGIKMKNNHFYQQKYKFQENFFNIIDTQEKVYWLGFLYADGNVYIRRNSYYIKLSVCDKEVIEKFKRTINAEYPITISYSNNRINPLYSITICSKQMGLDLIDKGCIPCKSLILKFPKNIPAWLNRHFIRGYFDGDGCVCVYNKKYIRTCSSKIKKNQYIKELQ